MIKMPKLTAEQRYDVMLPRLLKAIAAQMKASNDDGFFIYTGRTGSGKSKLSMHSFDIIAPDVGIEQYALNVSAFAKAQKQAIQDIKDGKTGIYVYDESNLSKRSAMSTFNRDVINLMFTNRIFGVWQLWCWVSVDMLDKPFIQERLCGLFYCHSKEVNVPRRYFYFAKDSLIAMLEAGIPLTHANLYKYRKRYAAYMGWFRDYDGRLSAKYAELKIIGATSHSDDFFHKYADESDKSQAQANGTMVRKEEVYDKLRVGAILDIHGEYELRQTLNRALNAHPELHDRYVGKTWHFTKSDIDLIANFKKMKRVSLPRESSLNRAIPEILPPILQVNSNTQLLHSNSIDTEPRSTQ